MATMYYDKDADLSIIQRLKVAIIGANRPRLYWAMCAAQALGAVPVPIYSDSVAEEMAYVLVYAGKDSLNSKTLGDRVIGVSIPGYTDEALNAVTKLIRGASTGGGPWSAIAVPFKP